MPQMYDFHMNGTILASRESLRKPVGGLLERLGALLGRLGPILGVMERSFGDFVLSWTVLGPS